MKITLFAILTAFVIGGCVHYHPSTVSTTSLVGKYEKPIRVSNGKSKEYYILGFIGPIGNASVEEAIRNAKEGTAADTMVNVFVERKDVIFPLIFRSVETTVYGTLIRYEEETGDRPQLMKKDEKARIDKLRSFFKSLNRREHITIVLEGDEMVTGLFQKLESDTLELISDNSGKLNQYNFQKVKKGRLFNDDDERSINGQRNSLTPILP